MLQRTGYFALLAAAAATALVGCPAMLNNLGGSVGSTSQLTNSTPLSPDLDSELNDTVSSLEGLADLTGDSGSAASFLSSALEDSSGTGMSTQGLRAVQDVSGNLANFSFPTLQSSASMNLVAAAAIGGKPLWLASGNTFDWVSRDKRWTTTKSYYVNAGAPTNKGPFGEESTVVFNKDGTVHSDEVATPEVYATRTAALANPLPSMFTAASANLIPAAPFIRQATISFPVSGITDGNTNTAVGFRWIVHNDVATSSALPWGHLYSWIRALQINRTTASGSVTLNHYDVATQYTAEPDPNHPALTAYAPYEYISDDYNVATKADYHMDRVYTNANTTWTGTGTFTGADGLQRTTVSTWNDTAASGTEWTRAISWKNAKGHKIVVALDYNTTYDGTGTVSVDGTEVATLAWPSDFKGTMTILANRTVRHYRAPRP
ncbi:MAG: hypothetical protein KGR26_06440 [Cyanobacteria bacterium REEB65]|nr:hypothetical protein [Cyanobacteria bacterium REEB65]